jgi:hypothetical protein
LGDVLGFVGVVGLLSGLGFVGAGGFVGFPGSVGCVGCVGCVGWSPGFVGGSGVSGGFEPEVPPLPGGAFAHVDVPGPLENTLKGKVRELPESMKGWPFTDFPIPGRESVMVPPLILKVPLAVTF